MQIYFVMSKKSITFAADSLVGYFSISIWRTFQLLITLKAHAETPEFKKYVAEIEACGQMKLERFEF